MGKTIARIRQRLLHVTLYHLTAVIIGCSVLTVAMLATGIAQLGVPWDQASLLAINVVAGTSPYTAYSQLTTHALATAPDQARLIGWFTTARVVGWLAIPFAFSTTIGGFFQAQLRLRTEQEDRLCRSASDWAVVAGMNSDSAKSFAGEAIRIIPGIGGEGQ